jgi:hypothetical protein
MTDDTLPPTARSADRFINANSVRSKGYTVDSNKAIMKQNRGSIEEQQ